MMSFLKGKPEKNILSRAFFPKANIKINVLHSDYSEHSRHKDPGCKRVISIG